MAIKQSELILNPDGSIYHLNLHPEDIANTIILVGDQDRVNKISTHFDTIDVKKGKREFHTHTGVYKNKKISVISTGIGTDNIDIVINELDALVNIDFKTRSPKTTLTSLNIIRIGTSGTIDKNIPVDSFLLSTYALGFDGLLNYYQSDAIVEQKLQQYIEKQIALNPKHATPYAVEASKKLINIFDDTFIYKGITATNSGFYAPQGRVLRLALNDCLIKNLSNVNYNGNKITNLEMETSGIYGMSKLLGHHALSLNAIIANRITGQFSENPEKTIEKLITYCLNKI